MIDLKSKFPKIGYIKPTYQFSKNLETYCKVITPKVWETDRAKGYSFTLTAGR